MQKMENSAQATLKGQKSKKSTYGSKPQIEAN